MKAIQISEEVHKVIRIYCAQNGSTIKDVVENAVKLYINGDNNEKSI